jgi:hypothetical protein
MDVEKEEEDKEKSTFAQQIYQSIVSRAKIG